MSKACTKCGVIKPHEDFNLSSSTSDGLQSYCKECSNSISKEHYYTKKVKENIANKHTAIRHLGSTCHDCGMEYQPDNLPIWDFDHKDPKHKSGHVSQMLQKYGWTRETRIEVQKCRLLCANCHRLRTAKAMGPLCQMPSHQNGQTMKL